MTNIVISGLGITSAIGQGKTEFTDALLKGRHVFDVLKREGRQYEKMFLGAEIDSLNRPQKKTLGLRSLSYTAQVAITTLEEAWCDAKLSEVDPLRIGLIIGGSNVQQRELMLMQQQCKGDPYFMKPHYAMSFMDSDLCGVCTEAFGIKGLAYTVGGASASGQLAVIQAVEAVLSNQVDVCIALGALKDLSYYELHAFFSLGAMGSHRFADDPASACRPFDQDHDGFIYGESCGAIVIEKSSNAASRHAPAYVQVKGWGIAIDGHRNPNPSLEGEVRAIQTTLDRARISPKDIDYINPHGTGSKLGDQTELKAFQYCNLSHAKLNATKSITGHGLSSSGCVEIIATVLQMKARQVHPSRNLCAPIQDPFNWVFEKAQPHTIRHALTMSLGFGGINTGLCLYNL